MEMKKLKDVLHRHNDNIIKEINKRIKPLFMFTVINFVIVYFCLIGIFILSVCK